MRTTLIAGCVALVVASCIPDQADARRRYSHSFGNKRPSRNHGYSAFGVRGVTEGQCPCNGGNVCVGPRGGRYCITSGGNKRYGV